VGAGLRCLSSPNEESWVRPGECRTGNDELLEIKLQSGVQVIDIVTKTSATLNHAAAARMMR
jgi:hypothetical protein